MHMRRITHGKETYISTSGDVTSDMVRVSLTIPLQALQVDSHARRSGSVCSRKVTFQHSGGHERCEFHISLRIIDPSATLCANCRGKEIYSGEKSVMKSRAYEAMMHRVPNTITLRDRTEHGRRRRILGPGFSDQAIKSYEGKIRVIVGRFCAALKPSAEEETGEGWSASRNIARWSTPSFSPTMSLI